MLLSEVSELKVVLSFLRSKKSSKKLAELRQAYDADVDVLKQKLPNRENCADDRRAWADL